MRGCEYECVPQSPVHQAFLGCLSVLYLAECGRTTQIALCMTDKEYLFASPCRYGANCIGLNRLFPVLKATLKRKHNKIVLRPQMLHFNTC